ncbi:MAG: PleD family two-component system response regulator, partial [Candidatus Aminicenantales bacterium]
MAEIILVDDDRVTLTMLEMVLSRHGYTVFSAQDGVEALRLVQEKKPAVVISDMLIPRMDGMNLCRKIKQDRALTGTRVILMTAVYKSVPFQFDVKECGADRFIKKP